MANTAERVTDWKRIAYFLVVLGAGVAAGYFGGSLIHDNHEASEVIITVFPILAGFLIAIMTIVGDPTVFAVGPWRAVELARNPTFDRLARQKWLFLVYLATVACVFAAALLKRNCPRLTEYLERVYLGLAVISFLLSVSLPGALMKIQLERYDIMISRKKSGDDKDPV
jgi:hypothetical protein